MTMTRKDFLRTLVGAGAGAVSVAALAGCGGGDDGGATADAAPLTCASPSSVIGGNHGHVMMVSMADVTAAANKTYNIMGTALHDHTVMVTAAQFAMLKDGTTLSITSSSDGTHSHTVTVMCAT
jgi:hypothetical protein